MKSVLGTADFPDPKDGKNIFSLWRSSGLAHCQSDVEKFVAQTTNLLVLLLGMVLVPHILFYLFLGLSLSALICTSFLGVGLLIFLANRRGHFYLARMGLLVTTNLCILIFSYLHGLEVRTHWLFIPMLVTPSLLFWGNPSRFDKAHAIGFSLPIAGLILVLIYPPDGTQLTPGMTSGLQVLNVISLIVGSLFQQQAFRRLYQENQRTIVESRQLLTSILDNLPLSLFAKDSWDSYRFVLWNKKAETQFQLPADKIIGKTDFDFFPPEEANFFRQKDEAVIHANHAQHIPEEKVTSGNGEVQYLRTQKVPVHGRYLIGISENITDLKKSNDVREALQAEITRKHLELKTLFENMHEGIVLQNRAGEIIQFNPAALKILGLSADEIQGRTSTDSRWKAIHEDGSVYLPEDHPGMRALRTGRPIANAIMGVVEHSTGHRKWISINATPIFEPGQQEVSQALAIFRDVTEERSLACESEKTSERLQFVTQALKIGIWDWDFKKNVLVWDDAMYELYGMRKADFNGAYESFQAALAPGENEKLQATFADVFSRRGNLSTEFRVRKPDGSTSFIHAEALCFYDSAGKPERLVGANWDVTDIHKKDEEILKAFGEVQNFFSVSADMLAIIDHSGHFKKSNPALEKTLGYSPQELADLALSDIIHPDDAVSFGISLHYIAKSTQTTKLVVRLKHRGGAYRLISWSAAHSPQTQDIFLGGRDITEERDQELKLIQASKMSSLGEMSAGIAHEINNPLAILSGKAQQIASAADRNLLNPATIKKHAVQIQETAERIATIIKGLRTFARDGSQDPFVLSSVAQIIQDTLALCATRFSHHDVTLTLADIPPRLEIDCRPSQIAQVLHNLLNNSFDAVMGRDEKWVRIELLNSESTLRIDVVDSGPGIKPELSEKIMQPFFTTKEDGKGTGLGLSIAQGIIENHAGRLSLNRTHPHTCFSILLPKRQRPSTRKVA